MPWRADDQPCGSGSSSCSTIKKRKGERRSWCCGLAFSSLYAAVCLWQYCIVHCMSAAVIKHFLMLHWLESRVLQSSGGDFRKLDRFGVSVHPRRYVRPSFAALSSARSKPSSCRLPFVQHCPLRDQGFIHGCAIVSEVWLLPSTCQPGG